MGLPKFWKMLAQGKITDEDKDKSISVFLDLVW